MKVKTSPGLYIVATPIGNLDDITIRAIETLKNVDVILCEDTRHSQKLLTHLLIKKPLWSYNDHSTDATRNKIVTEINNGKSIALISDAGTPLISDPGYKLVEYAYKNNIPVTTCPGACSPIAALTISGCPTNKFLFLGFMPIQKKERIKFINTFKTAQQSSIIFSTPRKIDSDLKDIQTICGNIKICVLREITKIFEQRLYDTISSLLEHTKNKPLKGEIVIIIPPQEQSKNITDIENKILELKQLKFSSKDIVKIFSVLEPTLPKKEIYKHTL